MKDHGVLESNKHKKKEKRGEKGLVTHKQPFSHGWV